ncbi:MAG: hypothetical protein HC880_14770 [Bacteroidia bacterium]|nr:hypothetical protein [Bacteroidia bacterium]
MTQNNPTYTPNPVYTNLGASNNPGMDTNVDPLEALNNPNYQNPSPSGYNYSSTTGNTSLPGPQLATLSQQLGGALAGFSRNEAYLQLENDKLYIHLADDMLFDQYGQLSERGTAALRNITQQLKSQAVSQIIVESEPSVASPQPAGYPKAEAIARLLGQQGLPYAIHQKSTSPLAFDTSGTQAKDFWSSIIIK